MKYIYDKKLSEIFKKAFANHEPPYDPSDWRALQGKLRAQNRKRKRYTWYKRSLLLLLLLGFLFVGTWLIQKSESLKKEEIKIAQTQSAAKLNETQYTTNTESKVKLSEGEHNNNKNVDQNIDNQDYTKKGAQNTLPNIPLSNKAQNQKPADKPLNTQQQNALDRSAIASAQEKARYDADKEQLTAQNQNKETNHANKLDITTKAHSNWQSVDLGLTWKQLPQIVAQADLSLDSSQLSKEAQDSAFIAQKTKANSPLRLRWIASGLAIGPTVTRSKHAGYSSQNVSFQVGVTSDFSLSQRLSLATGLYYTKRQMSIYPENKEIIPTNNHTSNDNTVTINQERIGGSWQLIEMPVLLRYDFHQKKNTRFFVGAGFNNLFYIHEYYREDFWLQYSQVPDPRVSRTQRVLYEREASNVIDLASMLYFSAGIETRIGKGLSLQVEPYWQLPVRSLGSEGVFVQTGGINMRLQYSRR
ncbi:MAG: PorT family protein [Bernardetiaceae bacterium]|nr:PorT family protein [Bernardetiaceae bacterium]